MCSRSVREFREEFLSRQAIINGQHLDEMLLIAEYQANLRVENMKSIEKAICKRPAEKMQDRVWKGKIEPWMICWDKFCTQCDELSSILDRQTRLAEALQEVPKRDYEQRLREQEKLW